MSGDLFFADFDVEACMAEIQEVGGCTIPNFVSDQIRLMLLNEVNQAELKAQPEVRGPYSVKQAFAAFSTFERGTHFRDIADNIEVLVARRFNQYRPKPMKTPLQFNRLVVQRYQPGPIGISPHRDGQSYINLVAILVLEGKGRFCFCDDRSGINPKPVRNQPGDLMLMRAPEFLGKNIQPFHFVDNIEEQRTTFCLRQRLVA